MRKASGVPRVSLLIVVAAFQVSFAFSFVFLHHGVMHNDLIYRNMFDFKLPEYGNSCMKHPPVKTFPKRYTRKSIVKLFLGTKSNTIDNTKKSPVLEDFENSDGSEATLAISSQQYPKQEPTIHVDISSTTISISKEVSESFSYVQFAQSYPFVNNLLIATIKTAAADLMAQTVIGNVPLLELDVQRSLLFCLFGCFYLGAFQYAYQVQVFKKMFPSIEQFTEQSWSQKLKDGPGLLALGSQTAVDLTVLTLVYLPAFYIFKAIVFSEDASNPALLLRTGIDNYQENFFKDEFDLLRVWLPADLVCFSVPLYLRLPVRHVVSFVWTAYLSFARGGH